jgi:hypothetical protein
MSGMHMLHVFGTSFPCILYEFQQIHVIKYSFFFFVIPFYLQSVPVHSANCVETCIQWHVEECSVVLHCT